MSKHFQLTHGGDTASFSFVGIEKVYTPVRGGDHQKNGLAENPDGYLI